MSQWSNFAPFGEFAFSGESSESEKIYDAQLRSLGPAFAGPNDEAETYADSMCFGAARLQIQAAGAQDDPTQVNYLLEDLERDWRVYNLVGSTLAERRTALAVRMAASAGASDAVISAGLTTLLGSLFVHYRPMNVTPLAEVSLTSATPSHSPLRSTPIKKIILLSSVMPGSHVVQYTRVLDDGNPILIGDKLVIAPGLLGTEEVVSVTSVGSGTFGATFQNPHANNTQATTGPFCRWGSNQRHSLVVVDPSVMTDSVLLVKIHEFMRRAMTVVSTWLICTETSSGYVGPWVIGSALIGQTPIGVSGGETAILTEVP